MRADVIDNLGELLETAACLWEYAQDGQRATGPAQAIPAFMNHSFAEIREAVVDKVAVQRCARDWLTSREKAEGRPFDWEFVPQWFEDHFDWETLSYEF